MAEFVQLMAAPMAAALVLVAMHGYLGTHVVKRGVIFVDIALAQLAAFGVAIALLLGAEVGTNSAWVAGLLATLAGAVLLSATRTRDPRVPQEAYIGIIYVVFSAAVILILAQVPHGGEEIEHLLVGTILWVSWTEVLKTAVLYAVLGLILWRCHRPLESISDDPDAARARGLRLRRWDFLFYGILGTVVTSSVQIAGVLLVFTFLVVPTVMALRLHASLAKQLGHALIVGVIAVVAGSALSYALDLPTGAVIVCVYGSLLVLQVAGEAMARWV